MIDEARTLEIFGYTSDELTKGSHKNIVAVCDCCGAIREVTPRSYRDLCHPCALTKSNKNRAASPDYNVRSINDAATFTRFGHHAYDLSPNSAGMVVAVCVGCGKVRETPKQFYADLCHPCRNKSDKNRQKVSAARQGMSYADWDGYATEQKYCYKFNEDCRERNRSKYGHRCFVCGKPQSDNTTNAGNDRKLSVHHYDLNKMQGCNDHEWKLVPLCTGFHTTSHNETWLARIEYLIEHVWYPDGVWTPDALC